MNGLYRKYRVTKWDTGEEVSGFVFVLKPKTDPVALAALELYARLTPDADLSDDLMGAVRVFTGEIYGAWRESLLIRVFAWVLRWRGYAR